MEKQRKQGLESLFVTYEQALLAKEKGFNERCLGNYWVFGDNIARNGKYGQTEPELFIEGYSIKTRLSVDDTSQRLELWAYHHINVPLYQQIVDWFREEHGIHIHLHFAINSWPQWWDWEIQTLLHENVPCRDREDPSFDTKYLALNDAIFQAFKLI